MCDYYTFACRFQCLPETHHFPPNWISYIVAYIWLITNDGIPSHYEHRVNYSKKFIFISILTYIMILERRFLQKKREVKIHPVPTCFSFSLYVKSAYFYCWTHQIHITAKTPPALPVWSSLRNAIKLRHPGPNTHLLHNVGFIGRSVVGVNVIFIRLIKPLQIQPVHESSGAQSSELQWVGWYGSAIPPAQRSQWTLFGILLKLDNATIRGLCFNTYQH